MASAVTYESLFYAYEDTLRSALVERLGGDTLLPMASGGDLAAADANIRLYAVALFNDERRRVPTQARVVHLSEEFRNDPLRNTFRPKIDRILHLLEAGDEAINDPVNQFLSSTVEHVFQNRRGEVVVDDHGRPKVFQDYMLYDWGIHHFHVEEGRGRHLLFVMLLPGVAYVLKLGTHGQEFNDPAILEVAERNFPGILPRLEGITSVEAEIDSDAVAVLRRANIAYAMNVGGNVVRQVELRSTDGTPVRVTYGRDFVARQFRAIQQSWESAVEPWVEDVRNAVGGEPDEVGVSLYFTPVPMVEHILFRRGGSGAWTAFKITQ